MNRPGAFRNKWLMSRTQIFLTVGFTILSAMFARADQVIEDQSDAGREYKRSTIIVPYAFSTEALDTGIGAVLYRKPFIQSNAGAFLTGYGTANSSFGLFGGIQNIQLTDRLFFNPTIGLMSNDQQRFYGELGYDANSIPSGSNDSDEDDFFFGGGLDTYLHLTFRYVLPTGVGKEAPPHRYITLDGLLVDGSTHQGSWNPRTSGRTLIYVRPFYQRRTMDIDADNVGLLPPEAGLQEGDEVNIATNGVEAGIEYDNRDFATNPAQGSLTRVRVTRDFGWFDSANSWTALEFSFSKYWDLGATERFAQRVFAVNAWTTYVPSWSAEFVTPDFVRIRNRPPSNRGATLGGVERLRGYPRGRFNDKAAIYYAAELRLIPRWDPFRNWPLIRDWPWRWWQAVVFAEVGRVAPSWHIGELHEDLKWSAGAGLRFMIGGGIIRLDFATSEESTQWWVMASQAY